jgi:hypothetical protein
VLTAKNPSTIAVRLLASATMNGSRLGLGAPALPGDANEPKDVSDRELSTEAQSRSQGA